VLADKAFCGTIAPLDRRAIIASGEAETLPPEKMLFRTGPGLAHRITVGGLDRIWLRPVPSRSRQPHDRAPRRRPLHFLQRLRASLSHPLLRRGRGDLELVDRAAPGRAAAVHRLLEGMVDVVLDEGLLRLRDGLLDGVQLLGDVHARPPASIMSTMLRRCPSPISAA
jgi:hypothetical protein